MKTKIPIQNLAKLFQTPSLFHLLRKLVSGPILNPTENRIRINRNESITFQTVIWNLNTPFDQQINNKRYSPSFSFGAL